MLENISWEKLIYHSVTVQIKEQIIKSYDMIHKQNWVCVLKNNDNNSAWGGL